MTSPHHNTTTVILKEKYELCTVSTVAEAKRALKEHIYKFALVDLSLRGGVSGIDLLKHLKNEFPDFPIPIVITAHAFPTIRVEAIEAGAAEFFTKPILSGVLLKVMEKYETVIDAKVIPTATKTR